MIGLEVLEYLAKKAPYQLYRYAMPWNEQFLLGHHAVQKWEKYAPNSITTILNAYATVIPWIRHHGDAPLGFKEIQTIHSACMRAEAKKYISLHAHIRKYYGAALKLEKTNCSRAGLHMLMQQHTKYPYHLPILGKMTSYHEEERLERIEQELYQNNLILHSSTGNLSHAETQEYRHLISHNGCLDRTMDLQGKFQKNISKAVDETLIRIYQQLKTAVTEEHVLTIIASGTQRLLQINPFETANHETFCIVLLNTLLMQVGLAPTLLANSKQFNGFSVPELVEQIQDGIQRTHSLCAYVSQVQDKPLQMTKNLFPDNKMPCSSHWAHVPSIDKKTLSVKARVLITQLCQSNKTMQNHLTNYRNIFFPTVPVGTQHKNYIYSTPENC